MDKKRYGGRRTRRRTFKRRRRTGLWVFVVLVVLTLMATILYSTGFLTLQTEENVEQVEDPTMDEAPEIVGEGEEGTDESADEDEGEATPVVPDDPAMFLSVPKLDIIDALVLDGEVGLELGAQHLEGTGYPWLPGSNTYIAGHRVGFPGTGSDRIFFSLPSMAEGDEIILRDSNGREYTYRVSEVFAVTPFDLWVTEPTGRDTITLQACTETPDDWTTIGPSLMSSGPESGRLIVRGELVS